MKFYQGLQSFEADIVSTTHVEMAAKKTDMGSSYHLALLRPNSFALIMQAGMNGGSLISDGNKTTTYMPMFNKYTTTDAPRDLSELAQPMGLVMVLGGLPLGIENFLDKDPIKSFSRDLTKSEYVGLEKIGDKPAHHLRLVGKVYSIELWIADGAQPFLLQSQITPDMKNTFKVISEEQKKKMPAGFDTMSMSRTNTFSNWKINQSIAADEFQFKPPLGAQLVDDLFPHKAEPPHPLIGKPAPDFELAGLDGKTVKLSSLKGKIVVLDFWATWCGPCVAALPIVSEVTSSFKDRGVVFYAVNLGQKAEDIAAFQKEKDIVFPVLLDAKEDIAKLYLAKAIPQTVLIDKSGKIQAVHIGFQANLKKELTQQLGDMVAGKDISVSPAPAKEK